MLGLVNASQQTFGTPGLYLGIWKREFDTLSGDADLKF